MVGRNIAIDRFIKAPYRDTRAGDARFDRDILIISVFFNLYGLFSMRRSNNMETIAYFFGIFAGQHLHAVYWSHEVFPSPCTSQELHSFLIRL